MIFHVVLKFLRPFCLLTILPCLHRMKKWNVIFEVMNEDLDSLGDWFKANKLLWNVKKAVTFCFQILKFHKDLS